MENSSLTARPYAGQLHHDDEAGLDHFARSFHLPELSSRLPTRIHQDWPMLETRVWRWVRQFLRFSSDHKRDVYINGTASWAAMISAGWNAVVAELAIEYTFVLFLHDDMSAQEELARSFVDAPPAGRLTGYDGWLGIAFEDIWRRSVAAFSPQALRLTEEALREYFGGCLKEVPMRRGVGSWVWPGWEPYLAMRRETIAMRAYLPQVLAGLGLEVTEEQWAATARMRDIVCDHVALVNDVVSLRRELLSGECVNSIAGLALHHRVPLQDAVDEVCQRIDALEAEFLRLQGEIGERYPGLRAFLDGIAYIISGNQHWSYLTQRYHGDSYLWNGLKTGIVEMYPDRTVIREGKGKRPLRGG